MVTRLLLHILSLPFVLAMKRRLERKEQACQKKKLEEDEVLRTRRIRNMPTEEQKKLFHRWFGVTRRVYNEALWLLTDGGWKPSSKPLKGYHLNQEKNVKSHLYPFVYDHALCPIDAKDMAMKELCDAIAATRESLIAKKRNQSRFQMKRRAKKDSCQRVLTPNDGGNAYVKWNKNGFIFWSTKDTGLVKPYKRNELQKLPSEECSHHTVTLNMRDREDII